MYKIIGREIINPNQVDKLKVVKGKDKVTLLTCEPYTSRKYRLLVYGERVEK
ncbi:sortase [Bacillus paranthracis]